MAKSYREIFADLEKKEAKEEYQRIKKLNTLTPDELWEITDENFYKWINRHYYPKLLEHFRKHLALFEQWQKIWNLTDERILELGITSCIETKEDKKNIYKYIIESSSYYGEKRFVSKVNLDGKIKPGGPYFTYKYKLIEGFVSYFDWFNFQSKPQNEKVFNNDLLRYASKSGVDSDGIQTILQDKFYMLKMGGGLPKINNLGILRTKYVEFANLSRLRLKGKIATQNKELTIFNSYVDDLFLLDCELWQVTFYKCKMDNLKIYNSKINTWQFIDCNVTGEIVDSELTSVTIKGGTFDVVFKDCKLYNVKAHHNKTESHFLSAYRALKQAYKNQGEEASEQLYYLNEKEYLRKGIIRQYFQNVRKNNSLLFKNKKTPKSFYKYTLAQIRNFRAVLFYLSKTLNFYYWGYGFKPSNVIKSSMLIILLFAILYFLQLSNYSFNQMDVNNMLESMNISVSSFSTLGYFSDKVKNVSESLVIFESVVGGLSIGAFIASASNMKF